MMHTLRFVWLWLGLMVFFSPLLSAQTKYKYSYVPKVVYQHQVFPITIVMSQQTTHTQPTFSFNKNSKIQPLFLKPLAIQNGHDNFYTFYFKANKEDIRIPPVTLSIENKKITFPSQAIKVKKLEEKKDFCSVLAADLKVVNAQVSNYDESHYIVSLNIEAYEANIENMKLNDVVEFGVDKIKRDFAKVQAEFYFIVPAVKDKMVFSYYNTIKKQYISIDIPIVVQDSSVATQSELNPKEDNFDKLKKYLLIALLLFFLLMSLLKKDFFYLVLAVVSGITLLTLYIPHKKICVAQGTPLYILPTQTSTVSTIINETIHTSLLGERDGYKKIQYQEGIIGWIKNETLCKN